MSETDDDNPSRATGGLGDSTERATLEPRAGSTLALSLLRKRWKMLGTILVTALTTFALYHVDGEVTKDVIVFGLITAALLGYLALTIRSDIRLE